MPELIGNSGAGPLSTAAPWLVPEERLDKGSLWLALLGIRTERCNCGRAGAGGCGRLLLSTLVVMVGELSERERQIMVWVAMGKTNPEIGSILCISEFTVKNHMKSIFNKLVVTNRAQAVAKLTRVVANA